MALVAPNKPKGSSESSDWECTNCGATLTSVNNSEIVTRIEQTYRCICSGILIPTRNSPFNAAHVVTVAPKQRTNQGGGKSYPGP